jgi:hypothetical protein
MIKTLQDFKNIHKDKTILILGLGSSIRQYHPEIYKHFITIGVNDISRLGIEPNYLVYVDTFKNFSFRENDKMSVDQASKHVINSNADYIFLYRYKQLAHYFPDINKIVDISATTEYKPNQTPIPLENLHYLYISPFLALTLAIHMGATEIAMIGVDFTGYHGAGKISEKWQNGIMDQYLHEINTSIKQIVNYYKNIDFVNLSLNSKITSFSR